MKIVYAFRRCVSYSYNSAGLPIDAVDHQRFLRRARAIGFEGIEVPVLDLPDAEITALRSELDGVGMPCVAIRGGGGATHPQVAAVNKQRMTAAVRFAAKIGANAVNSTVTTPPRAPRAKGPYRGESVSQGSSRQTRAADYERTASTVHEVATLAAELEVEISIEIHQNLLELIDAPNVGGNPDLGNIYWTYDLPEESCCEDAIAAFALHVNY